MTDAIIELRITESDLRTYGDHRLVQELSGVEKTPTLGGKEEAMERLMEILPRIIAEKIRKIIPEDYEISEIALAVKIKGNFAVVGIDGDVNIKFKPKPK